jgi:hypothetical protein
MSGFVGGQMRFHDHNNIEQISKLFMPQRPLVNTGLELLVNRRSFQVGRLNRLLAVDRFLDSRCQSRLCSTWRPRIFKEGKSTWGPQWRPMAFFTTI